nr:retrotransposon protein, putative, Ty1-copia subclass [Tanacetum cinerariifolium]
MVKAQALLDWIIDSGCSYHMTPRDNCVYSLDGHAVAGDLNASVEEKDSLVQGVIDYVHSDLRGPSQVESLEGKGYFLSTVDDYSKMLVKNQTRRTVKKLRTDNGLEFCNRKFEQLCIETGIARHQTVVKMPQQNRPPSIMIEKKTPMEMWSGHPSDYEMLRIFGYVAYSHVKQGKLEPRAVKCVLLGYPKGVKGCRLYRLNDESPKIVTSGNVVFNESFIYKDTLKDSGEDGDDEDQTDQEDDDDEDAGDQETDQTPDLTNYQLVRDSQPRTRTIPLRDGFSKKERDLRVSRLSSWENFGELQMAVQDKGRDYDMLIACKSKAEIGSTKSLLKKEFDMKELKEQRRFLVWRSIDNEKSVKMPLGRHFKLSLKDCPVRNCDVERMSKVSYANAVGSLMYLMVCTRLVITYVVSVVSRYLTNLGKNHWEAVKWILKYLWGTIDMRLMYGTNRDNHVDVTGSVDSDYAKDPDKGRSITGYTFLVQGCVVSWMATLHVVALSTIEAEYMALTEAVKEAIWLRGLLEELGEELNTVAVNCDNQGAIYLSRNHVFYERTKHINVRYHFIREVLEAKTVKVLK